MFACRAAFSENVSTSPTKKENGECIPVEHCDASSEALKNADSSTRRVFPAAGNQSLGQR
jgi:hypothetical protein